jgi:hypothetical protein
MARGGSLTTPSSTTTQPSFPLRLHETLWQTYTNGHDLVLIDTPSSIAELMANPLGRRAIGMEHQHAVRDTTDYLTWLESGGKPTINSTQPMPGSLA